MNKKVLETDKRKIANAIVRKKIRTALLYLLKEQSFTSISVTELIQKAGVSRSSFYRNYNSMDDILLEIIDEMILDYENNRKYKLEDFHNYEFILHIFKFYEKYADIVITATNANISINILDEITDYIIKTNGDMKSTSISKYELYYYSGAGHSVILQWLKSGMKESPEDMAREFCRISCNQ